MDFADGDIYSTLHFAEKQLQASQNKPVFWTIEAPNTLFLVSGRASFCLEAES